MFDDFNIDLSDVSESGLPPAGNYTAVVEDAVIKDTKAGTGQYLNVRWKIVGGDHAGSSFFSMYNFKNPNPKAEQIGKGQLKTIMRLAGKDPTKVNPSLLQGCRVGVTIAIENDDYGDKVKITKYSAPSEDSGEINF